VSGTCCFIDTFDFTDTGETGDLIDNIDTVDAIDIDTTDATDIIDILLWYYIPPTDISMTDTLPMSKCRKT
jgi:hypothetical protein